MGWRPTIYGSENEIGAMPDFFSERMGRHLFMFFAPIFQCTPPLIGSHIFLNNGGRLYFDTGDHPEYATPECRTSRDVLIWQKAGEEIFKLVAEGMNHEIWNMLTQKYKHPLLSNAALEFLEGHVQKKKIKPGNDIIRLYKNNSDSLGKNTYGEHENYLFLRDASFVKAKDVLRLHFISRIVWQGSGLVYYDYNRKTFAFSLSQRQNHILETESSSTTSGRALFNTRDEPLSNVDNPNPQNINDKQMWRRIHVICGDANMCENIIRLKYVSTRILIAMTEDDYFKNIHFDIPSKLLLKTYKFFSTVNKTFHDKAYIPELDGQHSAFDIQRMLLEHAKRYIQQSSEQPSDDILWGIQEWERIITLGESDNPWKALRYETDAATKKYIIELDMQRRGYTWSSRPDMLLKIGSQIMSVGGRLAYLDLEYHRLKEGALFYKLPVSRQCTDEEIMHAMENPPSDTRASARRRILEAIKSHSRLRIDIVDWLSITARYKKSSSSDPITFQTPDPFETDIEPIIREIAQF